MYIFFYLFYCTLHLKDGQNQNATAYRKVASSNKSRIEPHPGFFRLLMKGIFDAWQKVYFVN